MTLSILILLGSLALLVLGGEVVVRSSSKLALSFGVSPLVIGLTVVAFGTSAPELGVSFMAALKGSGDIAITNVVGSNIFNLGVILGICGLLRPLVVHSNLLRFDIPISIIATVVLLVFCLNREISIVEASVLLVSLIIYLIVLIKKSKKENLSHLESVIEGPKETVTNQTFIRVGLLLQFSIGILILVFSSKYLVQEASRLALLAGISESIIGLTLVAAGTSFPELISSLMATLRGNTDIAIGNVIGSNIFNILFILSSSSFASGKGLVVAESLVRFDIPILLGFSILCFPLLLSQRKFVRWEGALLLSSYFGYSYFLITRI